MAGFADKFGKKGGDNGDNGDNGNGGTGGNTSNVAGGFASRFNKAEKPKPGAITPDSFKKEEKGGYAESVKPKSASYTDQMTRRLDLVYLVHGKDRGRDAWHYVLVDKPKLPMFLKQIETGSIDVALFGEVLKSGWGKNPPPEIVKEIEDEFS